MRKLLHNTAQSSGTLCGNPRGVSGSTFAGNVLCYVIDIEEIHSVHTQMGVS